MEKQNGYPGKMSSQHHRDGNTPGGVGIDDARVPPLPTIVKRMGAPSSLEDEPHLMQAPVRSDYDVGNPSSKSSYQNHFDFKHPSVSMNDHRHSATRGLRGVVSRVTHDVDSAAHDGSYAAINGFGNSTALPLASGDSATAPDPNPEGANSFLVTLLAAIFLSPCLLAAVAQTVHCWKKRRSDRVERQVLAVSTHPRSRMLVLSEIFKNDSRPVTEEDASPKKKRVLVKKHRKKTRSERRKTKSDNAHSEEAGRHPLGIGSNGWSSGEEDDILARSDGKPMVVYVSSFDHLERHDVTAHVEQLLGQEDEDESRITVSGEKRAIVHDSNNTEHHDMKARDELSSPRQCQISAVDREEKDKIGNGVNLKIRDHDAAQGAHYVGRSNESELDIERGQNVYVSGTCDDENDNEDGGLSVASDIIYGSEDTDDVALESIESANTESQGNADAVPSMLPASDVESVQHELHNKPDGIPETTQSSTAADAIHALGLAPEIPLMSSLDTGANGKLLAETKTASPSNNSAADTVVLSPKTNAAPDIPPLTIVNTAPPKACISPRASMDEMDAVDRPSLPTSRKLTLPNLSGEEEDSNKEVNKGSIFRARIREGDKDDLQSIPEIQGCESSVTEVTSNVDGLKEGARSKSFESFQLEPHRTTSINDTTGGASSLFAPYHDTTGGASSLLAPYQMERVSSGGSSNPSIGLGVPIPIKHVESYQSNASSQLSYFSYEDISIASNESEVCAICLCEYDEGDIRIFSKRCTHAFHKECILEWLVKSHNECPCCRVDMVTKLEIKETSASLLGTERLARAMVVVEGSEMLEAPPFHARRGVRRPRARMARQMLARAREQRAQRRAASGDSPSMPPQSPNAHWLWSARFDQPTNSPSTNAVLPSPVGIPPGLSSMPRLEEGESHSPLTPTPRVPNTDGVSGNNTHNRDWLWATRFQNFPPNSTHTPPQHETSINPSRSSDAIMNPHETNAAAAAPAAAPGATPTRAREASMHDATAGSLFSSTMHNHWQQRQNPQTTRRSNNNPTSPSRLHNYWSRTPTNANSAEEEPLPVTVLPTI